MTRDVDIELIKRLAIVAMFSDDSLMERLVLKGGNLLDIVYRISTRASIDVDLSIDGDFDNVEELTVRVEKAIRTTFSDEGLVAFDIDLVAVPPKISEDMKSFWGGYKIHFKLLEAADFEKFDTIAERRVNAIAVGKRGSTKFSIDLSRHEYCADKERRELDGFAIYVYSPLMFVSEKLRSICQQMPEYSASVHSHPSARARDFVDIEVACTNLGVNFIDTEFQRVLVETFRAKKAPLSLLGQIKGQREYHRQDFGAVESTVKPGVTLHGFDHYFDFVVEKCSKLETLWNE